MKHPLLLSLGILLVFAGSAQSKTSLFHPAPSFTENKGQILNQNGGQVQGIYAKGSADGFDVYLTQQGLSYVVSQSEEDKSVLPDPAFPDRPKTKLHYNRIDVELTGATINKNQFLFSNETGEKSNYYLNGKQVLEVPHFKTVTVKNVYPGIDWVWKVNAAGKFEYDFIVQPGANVSLIKMNYRFADIQPSANFLKIVTDNAIIKEGALKASSDNQPVDAAYIYDASSKQVSFNIGNYDHSKPLTIDPPLALEWSAQYGGVFRDGLRGIATSLSGLIYMTGYSSSPNYPVLNAGGTSYFSGTLNGTYDAVVMMIDSGQHLFWSTYLGGSGDDEGNSITVGPNGSIYVTGIADNGFPLVNLTGAYNQSNNGGQDAFICRFTPGLALDWSTLYGGSGNDEGLKIHTDNSALYVAGYTNSPGGSFPTQQYLGGYYQTSVVGDEAFILQFDLNGQRRWGTTYGGFGNDYATAVATDSLGNVVVAGYTTSTNFPVQQYGGAYYQANNAGGTDGFMLRFNLASSRIGASYYGGSGGDYITDVTSSLAGDYVFTGRTNSTDFPTVAMGGFAYNNNTLVGNYDAFIIRSNNILATAWSTYYGGSGIDAGTGVATDQFGNLYVTGFTFSTDFPLDSSWPGAFFQNHNKGNSDGWVAAFGYLGVRVWSTYKGDTCYEYPADIAFDTLYQRFYIDGEGLLSCTGNLVNPPDTGTQNGGGASSDAFAWAFGSGDANNGGGGGGGGGGLGGGGLGGGGLNCMNLQVNILREPCSGQSNGSAGLSISGGTTPYDILWSGGGNGYQKSNLPEGYGYVEVKDSTGCINAQPYQLIAMTVNVFSSNISCFGVAGSASASVNSGTPSYSYAWSNGTTGSSISNIFSPGSYEVTVTDGTGCTANGSAYIDYDNYGTGDNINVVRMPTCNNNDGILVATDASGQPISVTWGIFTDSSSSYLTGDTVYNVGFNTNYVIDGAFACYNGTPYDIHQYFTDNLALALSIWVDANPNSCVTADGALEAFIDNMYDNSAPYAYHWSTGSNNMMVGSLVAGNYTVTATDAAGCTAVAQTHLAPVDTPSFHINPGDIFNVSCARDTNGGTACVNVTSGTPPFQYLWSNGNNTCTLSNVAAGTYSLTVTDHNSCTVSQSIQINYPGNDYLNFTYSDVTCAGGSNGSVTVQVATDFGNTPYQYGFNWGGGPAVNGVLTNLVAGVYTVTVTGRGGEQHSACVWLPASDSLFTVSIRTPNTFNCNSGNQAVADVVGGQGPFLIEWSDGEAGDSITGPVDGTVSVYATDVNGCEASYDTILHVSGPFTASYVTSPIICNGDTGKVVFTVTGGFPPYWGADSTYQYAGTQTYTIQDNSGCSTQLQVNMTQPPVLAVNETVVSDISCFGGTASVTITASGGVAPYAGTGTMTVYSGFQSFNVYDSLGCVANVSFPLSGPAPLVIQATIPDSFTCYPNGITVPITATGGTYPYSGTGTQTYTHSGNYTLHITDNNGCVVDTMLHINLHEDSTKIFGGSDSVCMHAQIALSFNNIENYVWHPNNVQSPVYVINNVTSDMVVYVTGNTKDGCLAADTFKIYVQDCEAAGLNTVEADNNIRVYPNPATDKLFIEADRAVNNDGAFELFTTDGKLVIANNIQRGDRLVEVDCHLLASAMYVLRLRYDGQYYYQRVVITK